jgi:hypothetical protein
VRSLHLALDVAPAGPRRDDLDLTAGGDGGANERAPAAADMLGHALG